MAHSSALRQLEFDALLQWLAPSQEEAGEKYERIRHRLLRYFESHHCAMADEQVDVTMDRVARRIAAGERIRSADPARYFYGVARNVFLEYRKQQSVQHAPHETPARAAATWSPGLECLDCCLQGLAPDDRELLEAYYLEPRRDLAARVGLTPNALRLRVFKQKQKLRVCLAHCLQGEES